MPASTRRLRRGGQLKSDFAASIQAAIVDVLIAKTEKAIQKFHPKTIMLGGGVAANKPLREQFIKLAKNHKIKSSIPKFEYCTDNAAMIGLAAYYKIQNHKAKFPASLASPSRERSGLAGGPKSFRADPNLELK